jgi:L-fuculose-phosphate aldolase
MPKRKEKALREAIISIGKRLYDLRLVSGRTGNLSCRLDCQNVLITARGTCLGELSYMDIVKVNLSSAGQTKNKCVSSEFPLHNLIYKNFPVKAVIHCHPPLSNAYFSLYRKLITFTSEAKFYLNKVQLIEQKAVTITEPQKVVAALKKSNLVVVKNHGVVSVAEDFKEALYLIETLEESVKVAAVARLFKKKLLDDLDKAMKRTLFH